MFLSGILSSATRYPGVSAKLADIRKIYLRIPVRARDLQSSNAVSTSKNVLAFLRQQRQ